MAMLRAALAATIGTVIGFAVWLGYEIMQMGRHVSEDWEVDDAAWDEFIDWHYES